MKRGYTRINRDELGGSLKEDGAVYETLRQKAAAGVQNFVLDNLYGTKESRATLVKVAKGLGANLTLVWLQTTKEQAQFFASLRQVRKYGKLFKAADYKEHRSDPGAFPPGAQFAYWNKFEEPTTAEGFDEIVRVPVVIDLGPEYKNKAVIFDYDGTLRDTKSGDKYPRDPNDVVLLPNRREVVQRLAQAGWLILGASNQSGISKEPGHPKYVSEAAAISCFEKTNDLLGVKVDYLYAPDAAGAPQTFFPKPCPGMGVYFIEKYKLNPSACVYVGDLTKDRTFADRCGFQFVLAEDFFK